MWAQLIKARIKPGQEEAFRQTYDEMLDHEREHPTGMVRNYSFRSLKDPGVLYGLIIFESEEKARARERDPETLRVVMRLRDVMDGQPEFVDLSLVSDFSP
jgi:quinol monooxygenase YgiN